MLRQETEQDTRLADYHHRYTEGRNKAQAPVYQPETGYSERSERMLTSALDRVCAPLVDTLSLPELSIQRHALRVELDSLVTAHRELEANSEQALEDAVEHFYRLHLPARQAGGETRQPATPLPSLSAASATVASTRSSALLGTVTTSVAEQRTIRQLNQEAAPAMRMTLALLVPFYLLHMNGMPNFFVETLKWISEANLYKIELFVVPFIVGILVDAIIGRRAARGLVMGIGLLTVYAVLFPSIVLALGYCELWPFGGPAFAPVMNTLVPNPIPGLCGMVLWPVMAVCGATLSKRIRRHT